MAKLTKDNYRLMRDIFRGAWRGKRLLCSDCYPGGIGKANSGKAITILDIVEHFPKLYRCEQCNKAL